MLDFTNASLEQTIVHYIGPSDTDELILSDSCLDASNELLNNLLRDFFLGNFKGNGGFYSFLEPHDQNEVFAQCKGVFDGVVGFSEFSYKIAQYLKKVSVHPNIKGGEFYVAYLHDCVVDGEMTDAIGFFKSENKDKFLKINRESGQVTVSCEFGVNPKKLDKGCIVFDTEKDFGYKLSVIDNTNRDEAKYWVEDFLNVAIRDDNFYQTKTTIDLCKNFVQDVITPQNNHEKLEQAELLTKTRDFFSNNQTFDQGSFENSVIGEPENIEAFREYKKNYEVEMGYEIPDEFAISTDAAKLANKAFKSCIKLDKNFHIYIHGKRERVEKGYDKDRSLNFYKLYFENEN